MEKGSDNRGSKRAGFKVKIDYSDVDKFFSNLATNLSSGGIFINTKTPHPVGSKISLEFLLPKTRKKINTRGVVVWSNKSKRPSESGMGIRFAGLTERDKNLILEVVGKLVTHV